MSLSYCDECIQRCDIIHGEVIKMIAQINKNKEIIRKIQVKTQYQRGVVTTLCTKTRGIYCRSIQLNNLMHWVRLDDQQHEWCTHPSTVFPRYIPQTQVLINFLEITNIQHFRRRFTNCLQEHVSVKSLREIIWSYFNSHHFSLTPKLFLFC